MHQHASYMVRFRYYASWYKRWMTSNAGKRNDSGSPSYGRRCPPGNLRGHPRRCDGLGAALRDPSADQPCRGGGAAAGAFGRGKLGSSRADPP